MFVAGTTVLLRGICPVWPRIGTFDDGTWSHMDGLPFPATDRGCVVILGTYRWLQYPEQHAVLLYVSIHQRVGWAFEDKLLDVAWGAGVEL